MKKLLSLFVIFSILSWTNNSFAQRIDYTSDTGFDIGFGIGGSYQQSDLRNFSGSAFDFTLGHSIYQNEYSFFSLEGRFRLLSGLNRAFDDRMNPDTTYNNVEYRHLNLDLELALTFNQLRKNTGIILSVFAGAGGAFNKTRFDLYDDLNNGDLYDYSWINPTGTTSRENVYNDLKEFSDGNFETRGINHFCITPTAGIYLGYQFSKRFSIGLMHKSNFFINEGNDISGANIDGYMKTGSLMDINHYTSLVFGWDINKKSGTQPVNPCNDPNINVKANKVYNNTATHEITGTITNVNKRSDIKVTVDGRENFNFNYYLGSRQFSLNLKLPPGSHTVSIRAYNDCGNDSRTIKIVEGSPCDKPFVNIRINKINASNATHELHGTITNINNRSDIKLLINGKENHGFSYNTGTNQISLRMNLSPGTHTLTVKANNECGQDSKTVGISVDYPCRMPVINFNVNEIYQKYLSHEVSGSIANVTDRSNIFVTVDGRNYSGFNFYPGTGRINLKVNLSQGTHTIMIRANNECGEDSKTVRVVVGTPCDLPEVSFNVREVNLNYATHEIRGTVRNIRYKSDISVRVNGTLHSTFQFIPNTKGLNFKLNLAPGTHHIVINAKNECGEDSETRTVTVGSPCDPPMINLNVREIRVNNASHEISGTVANVRYKSDIKVRVDGVPNNSFQFNTYSKQMNMRLNYTTGTHTVTVSAKNECGEDFKTYNIILSAPCDPPVVNFNVREVNLNYTSHEITGSVANVSDKSAITVLIDGVANNGFTFMPNSKRINLKLNLRPGRHNITIKAANKCGNDSKTVNVVVGSPCNPPVVNFTVREVNLNYASHEISGTVSNVKNKTNITVRVDGVPNNSFQFIPNTNRLNLKLKLDPGTHNITISANNECGDDSQTQSVVVGSPCNPPVVNFKINEINRTDATHELSGTITNVKNKSNITVKVDDRVNSAFQYIPSANKITMKLKLSSGNHSVMILASNECGQDSQTQNITFGGNDDNDDNGECGPRINPGNSDWQFCLVTPRATYNRSNLSNRSFSYSGRATSLFFKAIAGGGNATVNGKPYTISPGKYYLFTGNLNVTVSTKNPGSMGHWSVCITANKAPQSGTGNNRPISPCESTDNNNDNRNNRKVNNNTNRKTDNRSENNRTRVNKDDKTNTINKNNRIRIKKDNKTNKNTENNRTRAKTENDKNK